MADRKPQEKAKSRSRRRTRIDVGASRAMQAMPELLRDEQDHQGEAGRTLLVPAEQIEPDNQQVRRTLLVSPEQALSARSAALEAAEDGSPEYFQALLESEPQSPSGGERPIDTWPELVELAQSIRLHHLLQPIVVSEQGRRFRVIAGERRYLASLLAGHGKIWAVVRAGRPAELKLRVIQWTENAHRSDLSLIEVVTFAREIGQLYHEENGEQISRHFFESHLNLSPAQAFRYLAIARATDEHYKALREQINKDIIKSIKDAASWLSTQKANEGLSPQRSGSGKPFKLGRTEDPRAVRRLLEVIRDAVAQEQLSADDREALESIDSLEHPRDQRSAFRLLTEIWNKTHGDKANE